VPEERGDYAVFKHELGKLYGAKPDGL